MKRLLLLVTAILVRTVAAQQPLDRIVAVVGTRPILASQIEEEMVQAQAQGQTIPTDSVGRRTMRRQVLDRLIELELLVQQAQRDTSIKVTDQEVLDQVEQTYQNVRKQFSSETDFRDQIRQARFGSVEEWRRWLADEQRRELNSAPKRIFAIRFARRDSARWRNGGAGSPMSSGASSTLSA